MGQRFDDQDDKFRRYSFLDSLEDADSEREVVGVVKEYLARLGPGEISTLPEDCWPGRIVDRDDSYKTRIVSDPRGTLADRFSLRLPDGVAVRVHDSTSDVRWMVLPRRPAGTDGWSEEQLARLVTIDSLVGTAPALDPAALARSGHRAPG